MKHIINNYFDNVFVIAHPLSKRYDNFIKRWDNLSFNLSKFVNRDIDCINIDGYVEHIFENINQKIKLKSPLSGGQIAVALAHMLIYDEIIKNNLVNTLVLEDDIVFESDLNINEALCEEWDILSLFSGFSNGSSILEPINEITKFTKQWDRQGVCSYVIKSKEVAKYLFDKQNMLMDTADGVICDNNINVLALYPSACVIDNSPSIIVNGLY